MHVLDNGICVTCHEHKLVNGMCITCSPMMARAFNPNEPRDPHSGKWTSGALHAVLKIGKSAVKLEHHGDGDITLHDQHGGSIDLNHRMDLAWRSGGRSGQFRQFAAHTPAEMDKAGQRSWLTRYETRNGKPFSVAVLALEKTHVATKEGPHGEPYLHDTHTLHLPANGKGVEDPADLFARPGTPISTHELDQLVETLDSYAQAQREISTGHGSVSMHVTGKDYTLDPGKRGQPPIVLGRRDTSVLAKALNDAADAWGDPNGEPLQPGDRFQRVIHTAAGDITVTRAGPDADFWIESDTTAIQIDQEHYPSFVGHLDTMVAAGPDLKHLTKGP